MSSISSLDSGIWRSELHAGYGSRTAGMPLLSTNVGVDDSEMPMRGGPSDSVEGTNFWP